MSEDWKDLAEKDDVDHDAQMAALKVVQGQEEATSYPPLKGHKMKKGVVQWKSTVTYPHRIRLGTLLDRQEPNSGLKEEKLVTRLKNNREDIGEQIAKTIKTLARDNNQGIGTVVKENIGTLTT